MKDQSVSVSVVLPAYNEADSLEATVEATLSTLRSIDLVETYEVIIAEDGCTDETPAVAERLATEIESVHHIHSEARLGRGRALEQALELATGDVFVYFDTDLATDLSELEGLIAAVASDKYDIATGSRRLPESEADRTTERAIPSGVYNRLVRRFLGSTVHDHQCGFKAFDRSVLESIVDEIEADHWFWDTEVLVRAQSQGYSVHERPIKWTERGDSKVNIIKDALSMGSQLLRLWWQLRLHPTLWRYRTPLALLLTLLLGYVILEFATDPGEIIDEIANLNLWYLLVAGGIYLVTWPIRGLRYRDILRHLGYTDRVGFLTGAVFVSQMGNLLVPARAGDAVRAYIMKARRDVPYSSGFASLVIERLFDLLTITLLGAGVIVGVFAFGGTEAISALIQDPQVNGGRLALSLAIGVGVVALIGFVLLIGSTKIDDRVFLRYVPDGDSRLSRAIQLFGRFLYEVRSVSTRPAAVLLIGGSSIAIWTLDVLTATAVLMAFGVGLDTSVLLIVSFLAVCVGNLAKIMPISPGGIGPYEAAFAIVVVSLTPIGVSIAVAAAIVDHALKNIITAIGGLISTGVLNVSLVTAVKEGQASSREHEVPLQESPPSPE